MSAVILAVAATEKSNSHLLTHHIQSKSNRDVLRGKSIWVTVQARVTIKPMTQLAAIRADLRSLGSPEKAKASAWFFKTGPGQYGEGDVFIGVTVPEQRKIAHNYAELPLSVVETLLRSQVHEERLTALLILVKQFMRGDDAARALIYDFYLAHTACINNWDLVDASAEYIVGSWLQDKDSFVLERLARSDSVWERRIAILATFYDIKRGEPTKALKIADLLLHDTHDLIQKAVGWMLREIGKRCSVAIEEEFLRTRYKSMPRTMLRYAIERLPKERREKYLRGAVS